MSTQNKVDHTRWVAVVALWCATGLFLYTTWWVHQNPIPVKKEIQVVKVPATDDELLEFWFGSGDKAALRKRICK